MTTRETRGDEAESTVNKEEDENSSRTKQLISEEQTRRSTVTRSERNKLVTTRETRDDETETTVDEEEDENSHRTKQLISEEQTRRSTVRRSERDKLVTTRETRDDETVTRSGRLESTEIQERRAEEKGAIHN